MKIRTEAELKLAAVRVLLGDELAKEIVDDQWECINDLDDPFDEVRHTCRVGTRSVVLALRVLNQITGALEPKMSELAYRRAIAIEQAPKEELEAMRKGEGLPAAYYRELCQDFEGPGSDELLKKLLFRLQSPMGCEAYGTGGKKGDDD